MGKQTARKKGGTRSPFDKPADPEGSRILIQGKYWDGIPEEEEETWLVCLDQAGDCSVVQYLSI